MQPISHRNRRYGALRVFCLAVLTLRLPLSVHAEAEESVEVYKKLNPSVVSLSSGEGSGTGILVNSKGAILTNAHVVTSPLPFQVQVDVAGPNNTTETLTFKKVKIIGYHPTLDLALIKIDTKEHRGKALKPVVLAKEKGSPGQRVYVIGNPAAGGQVLTKSITSGMLSAVDRSIDGSFYYQIDAAINPGNSGGPVCDRSGQVLGIVTFKFVDADAVGFAIPLHEINQKSFVPLSERRSDPAKARDLLRMADTFSEMSRESARIEGPDGVTHKLYDLNAVVCYHEALLYDASNPTVFYNIGTILRTLDEDEVAIGYLAYSVQLAPWGDPKGDGYRELALAFIKKDQETAALAAWHEGLAKFPYSAKIWEDLAIYYIQHSRPVDAAVSAATALLIAERDTRRDVMQQVLRDARGVAGTELTKLTEDTTDEAIIARLDELLAASNKSRRATRLYVTREFEGVVEKHGGPIVEGTAKNIPADPLPRLPELARIRKAADAEQSAAAHGGADALDGDWIGDEHESAEEKLRGTAKPIVTNKKLVKDARTVADARITDLDVDKVVDVCWSKADAGRFLYVLQADGVVRKVNVADWTEERQTNLATPCSSMAMSKTGLFISQPTIQRAVLLDDSTLEIKGRFAVPNIGRIASASSMTKAYAAGHGGRSLAVLDGVTNRVESHITSKDVVVSRGVSGHFEVWFERFAIAPNGKFLICESSGRLHRLSLDGTRLIYEDGGPSLGGNPQQVVVSADSRYVALPCGGGNRDETHQGYNTFIYKISDLAKPVCIIDSGAYPQTLGFDFKARLIYAQNTDKQLITFTPSGLKQNEYAIYGNGEDTDRFLVHPEGHRVLLKSAAGLAWVELSE
jgi:tetratricopeptide (TPR) repeat protein